MPSPVYRKRSKRGINTGKLGVPAERVDPLLPPPGLGFIQAAAVVVAAHAVDVFAPVATQASELPPQLEALRVVRQVVMGTGHVSDVDRDVPVECRSTVGPAVL
ncbi:hypothetical protein [Mycobacterium sp. HM-7]